MTTTYITIAGDMLDLICMRHYGRQAGAVEAVLSANPRLADAGPVYPHGLRIVLPDLPDEPEDAGLISLWD